MCADKTEKRQLSLRQAKNCEQALEPVCKCRCGGQAHGAKRGGDSPSAQFFYDLPEDDPHHLYTKAEKREHSNARKREETRLKNERRMKAWEDLYKNRPIHPDPFF